MDKNIWMDRDRCIDIQMDREIDKLKSWFSNLLYSRGRMLCTSSCSRSCGGDRNLPCTPSFFVESQNSFLFCVLIDYVLSTWKDFFRLAHTSWRNGVPPLIMPVTRCRWTCTSPDQLPSLSPPLFETIYFPSHPLIKSSTLEPSCLLSTSLSTARRSWVVVFLMIMQQEKERWRGSIRLNLVLRSF